MKIGALKEDGNIGTTQHLNQVPCSYASSERVALALYELILPRIIYSFIGSNLSQVIENRQ